jgi:hypothetical protein
MGTFREARNGRISAKWATEWRSTRLLGRLPSPKRVDRVALTPGRTRVADGERMLMAVALQSVILYSALGVAAVVMFARLVLGWALDAS